MSSRGLKDKSVARVGGVVGFETGRLFKAQVISGFDNVACDRMKGDALKVG